MTDEAQAEPAATPPAPAQRRAARAQARQRVPRFTVADLRARPVVIGQTASVVAAAFHDEDPETELTAAEAEQRITQALGRKVNPDPDTDEE